MSKFEQYAGDAAWTQWFELCSAARCHVYAAALNEQIRAAMFAQLSRFGHPSSLVGDDDPVTFFDSYFQVNGARDIKKPLKSYFRHRIAEEKIPLREFICGTLFSAKFGRIHDIVRDWIAAVKGWKPHSILGADGKRHLQWERAAAKEDARESAGRVVPRPGNRLDLPVLRGYVLQMLDEVSSKIKLEKRKVAFLLNATAQGIPMSSPEVLAELGVMKSRAAKLKEECMKAAEKFFAKKEVETTDLGFARMVISVCAATAGGSAATVGKEA